MKVVGSIVHDMVRSEYIYITAIIMIMAVIITAVTTGLIHIDIAPSRFTIVVATVELSNVT